MRTFCILLLFAAGLFAQIAPVTTVLTANGGQDTEMYPDSNGDYWVIFDSTSNLSNVTQYKLDSTGAACSGSGTNCQVRLWGVHACKATSGGVLSPSTCASTLVDILAPLKTAGTYCPNCSTGDPIWDGNVLYFSQQETNTATPTAGCGAVCGNSELDPGKGYNYGEGSIALTANQLLAGTAITTANYTRQFYAGQQGYQQLGDCGSTAIPAAYALCGGGHADPVFSDDHSKIVFSPILYQGGVTNSGATITTTHAKWEIYWGTPATVVSGAPTVVTLTAVPSLGTQTSAQITNHCQEYIKANQPIALGGGVYFMTAAANLNSAVTTPPDWTGTTYTRPQATSACTAIGGDTMFSLVYSWLSSDVVGTTYRQMFPALNMPIVTPDAAKYPLGYSEFTRKLKQSGLNSYWFQVYTTSFSKVSQVDAAVQPNYVCEWALINYNVQTGQVLQVVQMTNMNTLHSAQNTTLLNNPALTGGMSRPTYNAALNVICGDARSGSGAGAFSKLTCFPMDNTNFPMTPISPASTLGGKSTIGGKMTIGEMQGIYPNSPFGNAAAVILGPALASGANPWPYADASQANAASYFGGLQSSPCYYAVGGPSSTDCYTDYWNTAATGTVSAVAANSTLTFSSGVNTQSLFCSGGTVATGNSTNTIPIGVDVWYSAGAHRLPVPVLTCPSPTTVTIYPSSGWPETSESAMSFNTFDSAQDGMVEGASSNSNYYDGVEAFYSEYFRSGNTLYRTYARQLADHWDTQPWIDQGQRAIEGYGAYLLHPRQLSLGGLILRALDGKPAYWAHIEAITSAYATYNMGANVVIDPREAGYAQYFLGLQMQFDPNASGPYCGSTTCALYARSLYDANITNTFTGARVTSGVDAGAWEAATFGFATWNSLAGTMTFTSGSNTVTSSIPLQSGMFQAGLNSYFTACPSLPAGTAPTVNSQCDAQAYIPTQTGTYTFTISPAYTGGPRTVSSWQFNILQGKGSQPYTEGMLFRAWEQGIQAGDVNAAMLQTWENGLVAYWEGSAYKPSMRAIWYGLGFLNYNALGNGNIDEDGGAIGVGTSPAAAARDLVPEIMGPLALAYKRNPNPTLHTFAENLYSAQWGGPDNGCWTGTNTGPVGGGALLDGIYVADLLQQLVSGTTCGYTSAPNVKYFGFQFGFGGGQMWPAVR